jgi:hypothetical protein
MAREPLCSAKNRNNGKKKTMDRFALILSILITVGGAAPVAAQTPHPTPSLAGASRKVPVSLSNPGSSGNTHAMSGQGCISGPTANRAQQYVNPITGKLMAAPIVEIPLTKGSGSVASATTRSQQAYACAHGTH